MANPYDPQGVQRTAKAAQSLGGVSKDLSKRGGAGKGDRNSAAWINSDKYQRSMRANEAYDAGEITLEEWRAIVHPQTQDQGE